ncbi:MAG TPA: sugar transferase [Acidobacteriaceae bacterium]|nr:sugar transferase [Acidobacteriaceae bacterium]
MPGDLFVENRSTLQLEPVYAGETFDGSEAWGPSQVFSVAALLQFDAGPLPASEDQQNRRWRNGSEWEQISLAVHRLRTNCLSYRFAKRILDVFIVVALLPALIPLLLIVAAIVRLSSPGPILYRQRRLGRFGREFTLWKFRSMYVSGDEILRKHLKENPAAAREWAETRKLKVDPRVTRLGNMLRRASLDELPQFLNVVTGSMSLVGPRPIVSAEVNEYRDAYFFYASAKPGLSGLWQVSGRSDLSYNQRVALDEEYVRRWNIGLDIRILWRTAGAVWRSQGAV